MTDGKGGTLVAGRKLNIAMLGHKRIPSREGGIEVVVEELAIRMVQEGHEVTCYNRTGHHVSGSQYDANDGVCKNSAGEYVYKGVRIKNVWTARRKGLAAMTSSVSASWKAACKNYNVVHIHAEGPAAMCWLPKLRRKKVVVTIHGLDWARAKWGSFATKYIKWGERQAVKHADQIIVLSRSVQEYFRTEYGRETVFIPNGVCRPERIPAKLIKERWGLEKDGYVLFLGRIVPEKGAQYLVEAWKGLHTDVKLVIAGGSSDTQAFMDELRKMAGDEVIFTGFQQGRMLWELYSNAYIYVLPSDLEGMPLSLLEAMSYGNCCLVSDISECVEVVEDKAAVFRRGNVEELRRALTGLLEDPEMVRKYKAAAAEFICNKYSWDDVVEKTLELYRK